MAGNKALPPNSVGWHILEGYPWWPVFVCDAFKLRPNLHQLGSGHRLIQRKARDFPDDYALVYFFGTHDFGQVRLKKGKVLLPWDCDEKPQFLKGFPAHLVKKKTQLDDLKFAIEEAEDFLSTPEDIRLPRFMVPSDLDPSMEPPPPMERDEVMDDGDDDDDDGDGDAGEEHGGSDNEDHDDAMKKKSSKKDKEAGGGGSDDKKRKKPATGDDAAATPAGVAAAAAAKSPPSKVAKKEKSADVKSEAASAKPSRASKAENKADSMAPDALNALLEKEIKWILANCQFEEMTTKTVRKLLEKRLDMDLRHHKASIKASVARVIAAMEDGLDAAAGEDASVASVAVKEEDAPASTVSVKTEAMASDGVAVAPVEAVAAVSSSGAVDDADVDMKAEEPEPPADSNEDHEVKREAEPSVEQLLVDAERELGLVMSDSAQLVAALVALQQQVPAVEREALASSALLPKLVVLRAHEDASVAQRVASLATLWGVDDLVPALQPVREEDILAMKETLDDPATSHDDVLRCLSQLSAMRLDITHMKNTGIARVVADLRQHRNDKVSIAAANLRKSWIQLTKSKTESKSDVDRVKALVDMNRVLEQKDSAEGESSHLAVLEKLQSLALSTQDIIESKIGVVVSKLRKSSNEKVAKAATQLRKKWKAEAAA
ncbi:hypothetical protein PybrP1_001458 [[Pythium] brassicae (nom. inval.)]|nr:hypothetical protein PybrP1_001458 [[Pythium] brassicae (nom. inval.)]